MSLPPELYQTSGILINSEQEVVSVHTDARKNGASFLFLAELERNTLAHTVLRQIKDDNFANECNVDMRNFIILIVLQVFNKRSDRNTYGNR